MGVLVLVSYFSSMSSVSVTLSLALIIASCFYSLRVSGGKLKKPRGNLLVHGSNPHRSLHALSQRYGGLMFLKLGSKPTIIASSKEAATAILKTFDSDLANRTKNMGATTDILLYNRNDFIMSSESRWPMLRKMTFRMRLFDDNNSEAAHFRVMMEDLLAEGAGIFSHRIGDFVPFLDWIGLGWSLHRAKSVNNRLDQFLVKKIEQQKRLILYELKSSSAEEG